MISFWTVAGGIGRVLRAEPLGGSFWMPPQGSTLAPAVDWLFYFIFYVSAFFFLLIVGLMAAFLILYRRPPGARPLTQTADNKLLEITWTVIPTAVVVAVFSLGFRIFMNEAIAPSNAYDVHVTGQKWKWMFTYPNGYVDENLHVPVDRPVRLILTSEDVIHSLYIPDFRLKKDAVPGRYNIAWFQATQPGEHPLYCAEYCGTGHSDMLAKVVVHEPGLFEKWLSEASNYLARLSPAEAGQILHQKRGCMQCHSIDGAASTGPTFKGLYGSQVLWTDGTRKLADENYLRDCILNPAASKVAGFENVMPTFTGRLTDSDITDLIEYIKSLKGAAGP